MKILSIETSCDETAIALVDIRQTKQKTNFTILGNHLSSQIDIHKQYGGVFPMMAKREHAKNIIPVLLAVLKQAKSYKKNKKPIQNKKIEKKVTELLSREHELQEIWNATMPHLAKPKIDAIAVTIGPGLEPALWVGIKFAQALSLAWDIPIIPVNHMEGHIFSIFPNKTKKFEIRTNEKIFPMLSLLVSGGHTEIVLVKDWMKYKLIGQTKDDAAGEAFDKVARMLGLPYPGGPEISKFAKEEREHNESSNEFALPRPMLHTKDYDFSFSGLKTAVLYKVRDIGELTDSIKRKIAREFEDAVVDVLSIKTVRAIKEYKIQTLIVGGGVSANDHLQNVLKKKVKQEFPHIPIHFPVKNLTTDNALMIAIAGYFQSQKKVLKNSRLLKANGNLEL